MNKISVFLLVVLMLLAGCGKGRSNNSTAYDASQAFGNSSAVSLSEETIARICAKYSGRPMWVSHGVQKMISCDYIRRLAKIAPDNLFSTYHKILKSAGTLDGLRHIENMPTDLDCGEFLESDNETGKVVECTSDVGQPVPFNFFLIKMVNWLVSIFELISSQYIKLKCKLSWRAVRLLPLLSCI